MRSPAGPIMPRPSRSSPSCGRRGARGGGRPEGPPRARGAAALIASVLDFDAKSGRTDHASAEQVIAFVREQELTVEWLLETHVHADHLSAAPYLRSRIGGRIGIGARVIEVQEKFGKIF